MKDQLEGWVESRVSRDETQRLFAGFRTSTQPTRLTQSSLHASGHKYDDLVNPAIAHLSVGLSEAKPNLRICRWTIASYVTEFMNQSTKLTPKGFRPNDIMEAIAYFR